MKKQRKVRLYHLMLYKIKYNKSKTIVLKLKSLCKREDEKLVAYIEKK